MISLPPLKWTFAKSGFTQRNSGESNRLTAISKDWNSAVNDSWTILRWAKHERSSVPATAVSSKVVTSLSIGIIWIG